MIDRLASADGEALARGLLLEVELVVAGHALRIEEAEVYFSGPGHEDPFAHRHPAQAQAGGWYFHRVGRGYRGGSRKGLDLTFGPEGSFGGLLIRAVRGRRLCSGPSRVVDLLLRLAGLERVADLDEGRPAADEGALLHLRPAPRRAQILRTARVGLTLERHVPGDGRPWHLMRRARLLTCPRIPEGRVHTVVALHEDGLSARQIAERTGSRAVPRYLRRYEAGRRDPSFDRFVGRPLNAADRAELHGVWRERFGRGR